MEYDQVPLSRVLFDKTESRYCYIDKVLGNAPIKPVTITRFYLPRVQTIFRTDMHNTNNSEGAFLVY
jgi:hypothetical protein